MKKIGNMRSTVAELSSLTSMNHTASTTDRNLKKKNERKLMFKTGMDQVKNCLDNGYTIPL